MENNLMARKPTGKPTGRPEKEIDWTLFEQLCAIQCTQSEIASMMKVHIDTLRDRAAAKYGDEYSNIYKKFCESGKCSLRRNQFVLSKTNASLAIWLGKQWLGQRDMQEDDRPTQITVNVNGGLASGLEVSAKKLPDSNNQSA
jgi:hypothetical protein